MTALYQRIRADDGAPIGVPGGLPRVLQGLSVFVLADLTARLGEAEAVRRGYAGEGFVLYIPSPPVPVSIERLWCLLALQGAGLFDTVEAAILNADLPTRLYYREAGFFRRDSAILNAFANGIGITDAQLSDLFRYAANLKALAAPV